MSFDQKIFFVYFGLFVVAAATTTYNLACPFIIKKFKDENECAQFYMQMANIGQVYALLIATFGDPTRSPNPLHREINKRYDEFNANPEQWHDFLSKRREEVFEFYVKWYNDEGHSRPASRVF